MDTELIYNMIAVVIFGVVSFFIVRSSNTRDVNSKSKNKDDIVDAYKKELYDTLSALDNDKKARVIKKKELLLKISDELSRNIFFEQVEIREIILDLADNY